jgi:hypothetical protein
VKKIIPVLALLALAGCAQSMAGHAANKEKQLWRDANSRAARECAAFPRSDRTKAVEAGRCVAAIVRATVMPHAPYPDLVEQLIQEQAGVSEKYRDGKIDLQQANAEALQLQARYQAQVMQRLHGGAAN